MSYLTPSNVLLFLLAIVGLIGVGFGTRAVILNHRSPFVADTPDEDYPEYDDDDDDDEDDDDDYDDDDEDDDDDDEYPSYSMADMVLDEKAESPGEITLMSRVDWVEKLEWRRAKLRAECPHLYEDDWFEKSRREFSLWAAKVYRENQLAA